MKTLLWLCVALLVIATGMCLYLTVSFGSVLLGPMTTVVGAYVTWCFVDIAINYEES